jgi:hypothetical protein
MESNQDLSQAPVFVAKDTEGNFGAVSWQYPSSLYNSLPRLQRDLLLQNTLHESIGRCFEQLTSNILAFMGHSTSDPASIDTTPSLHVLERECDTIGRVTWIIPQGLNDVLDNEQREFVETTVVEIIHQIFHYHVGLLIQSSQQALAVNI